MESTFCQDENPKKLKKPGRFCRFLKSRVISTGNLGSDTQNFYNLNIIFMAKYYFLTLSSGISIFSNEFWAS